MLPANAFDFLVTGMSNVMGAHGEQIRTGRSGNPQEKKMGILTSIQSFFGHHHARRRHYRTERLLHGLPAEIQKDIGWPGVADSLDRAEQHLRGDGRWH